MSAAAAKGKCHTLSFSAEVPQKDVICSQVQTRKLKNIMDECLKIFGILLLLIK